MRDDLGEDEVAEVRVLPFGSRGKDEWNREARPDQLCVGLHLRRVEAGRLTHQTCRVRQQVADGDPIPRRRSSSQILRNRIVHGELAVLHQQHDSGGDELLAGRRDLVDGRGRGRGAARAIGHAVAGNLDDLPVLQHGDRCRGDALPLHLGADVFVDAVHPCRGALARRGRLGQTRAKRVLGKPLGERRGFETGAAEPEGDRAPLGRQIRDGDTEDRHAARPAAADRLIEPVGAAAPGCAIGRAEHAANVLHVHAGCQRDDPFARKPRIGRGWRSEPVGAAGRAQKGGTARRGRMAFADVTWEAPWGPLVQPHSATLAQPRPDLRRALLGSAQPLHVRAHQVEPHRFEPRSLDRMLDAEDPLPGRPPQRRLDVDRIEAVPRRIERHEGGAVRGREGREAGVDLLGGRAHVVAGLARRRNEHRADDAEATRRQAPDALHRQAGDDQFVRDPRQSRQRLVDPLEDALGRKAVEDVVADVGQERPGRHRRRRFEQRPEARLQDAGQPPDQEVAVRAVGTAVAEGGDDLDVGPPGDARRGRPPSGNRA